MNYRNLKGLVQFAGPNACLYSENKKEISWYSARIKITLLFSGNKTASTEAWRESHRAAHWAGQLRGCRVAADGQEGEDIHWGVGDHSFQYGKQFLASH